MKMTKTTYDDRRSHASHANVNGGRPLWNRETQYTFARLLVAALALFASPLSMATQEPGTPAIEAAKTARDFVADFRRGVSFHPRERIDGLLRNGDIDADSLRILAEELRAGSPTVREELVELLLTVGRHLASPESARTFAIRHPAIIRSLLVEGFSQRDRARDMAEEGVRAACTPADLAMHRDLFLAALKRGSGAYLLITAKAKIPEARPHVDALSRLPEWRENPDLTKLVHITKAALGDTAIENGFIDIVREAAKSAPPAPKNRFYDVGDARDGAKVMAALSTLRLVGTQSSLRVACEFIRSPLKKYVPNAHERSVRYVAVDALHYNYPTERALVDPDTRDDWQAVEDFCAKHLGARFDGPTPELPRDNVYPHF